MQGEPRAQAKRGISLKTTDRVLRETRAHRVALRFASLPMRDDSTKEQPLEKRVNHRLFLTCQFVLATVGVVLLGYCAIVSIRANHFQTSGILGRAKRSDGAELLKAGRPRAHHSGASPSVTAPIEGSPLARLAIPELSLDLIVVENISPPDLILAPGRVPVRLCPGGRET